MTLPIFCLAVAVVELLCGVPMLVAPRRATAWLVRLLKEDALMRCASAALLVVAAAALLEDARVGTDLAGVVRLLAWVTAIKCLVWCWAAPWQRRLSERMLALPAVRLVMGPMATAAGVFFLWAAVVLRA